MLHTLFAVCHAAFIAVFGQLAILLKPQIIREEIGSEPLYLYSSWPVCILLLALELATHFYEVR